MALQGKTVLVGITGGIASAVCAYLLKKQGFRPIGIHVSFFDKDENLGPFQDLIYNDLDGVKKVCDYLDIPFYAVNAVEQFKDTVIDPMVGRVLSGHSYNPLIYMHKIIVEVLVSKMSKFNANLIATGHFAKVLKNQKSGNFELLTANDYQFDQSHLLSLIDEKVYSLLYLPLSEIKYSEMEKISGLLKCDFRPLNKVTAKEVMAHPAMPKFVESRCSKDMLHQGNIYIYGSEAAIKEHLGIHHYFIGKNHLNLGDGERNDDRYDEHFTVINISPFKGAVYIKEINPVEKPHTVLKFKHLFLDHFHSSSELDLTKPMTVYCLTDGMSDKMAGTLHFKTNQFVFLELSQELSSILPVGVQFIFYSRPRDKAKVIGSAQLTLMGHFDRDDFHQLPKVSQGDNDEENPPRPLFDKFQF